ncbi:MAG: response regulator [Patescibacteria group bacterium]
MLKKKETKGGAKKQTILLVEDDGFLANMYKTKLELEKYNVIMATNGESALRIVNEKELDLILLDIVLPKVTGFEVITKIKSDKELKKIPVIMLTNLGQKEDIEKGLKLGADEYLIKAHFLPSEVISKIKKLIDK